MVKNNGSNKRLLRVIELCQQGNFAAAEQLSKHDVHAIEMESMIAHFKHDLYKKDSNNAATLIALDQCKFSQDPNKQMLIPVLQVLLHLDEEKVTRSSADNKNYLQRLYSFKNSEPQILLHNLELFCATMAQEVISFANTSDSADQTREQRRTTVAAGGDPGDPNRPNRNKNSNNEDKKKKTIDDILRDAQPGRETNGKTKQYEKTGGLPQALNDFYSLELYNVRSLGAEKIMGLLSDGRKVIARAKSSAECPTLEVQFLNSSRKIKIRYTN
jgi:hypothetical protein